MQCAIDINIRNWYTMQCAIDINIRTVNNLL